jgi:hypothetical protein
MRTRPLTRGARVRDDRGVTSRLGYWIGGGLLAAGVLGAILWGVLGFAHIATTIDDLQRFAIPSTSTAHLEARKYTVYVEGPGADESTPPVDLFVTHARSERAVPVRPYSGSLTYSFDTSGSAVATVAPPRDGDYVVRARGVGAPGGYELALGPSVGGRIVATIVGAFAIGGVLGLAGLGLLVATGVRRSRRRAATLRGGGAP